MTNWHILKGPKGHLLIGKENGLLWGIGESVAGPFDKRGDAEAHLINMGGKELKASELHARRDRKSRARSKSK